MQDRKENIGNNIFDSILVLFFLFFVLSLSNHNPISDTNKTKHGISCENTISQSSAIIKISTSLIFNQKTWASEKKYPEFVNPVNRSFFENKKTDNQISIQSDEVLKNCRIHVFIVHYHLFFNDKDDIPFLS
jgi:hypothetical protein